MNNEIIERALVYLARHAVASIDTPLHDAMLRAMLTLTGYVITRCYERGEATYYFARDEAKRTVYLGEPPACTCQDFMHRSRVCKHIHAALAIERALTDAQRTQPSLTLFAERQEGDASFTQLKRVDGLFGDDTIEEKER